MSAEEKTYGQVIHDLLQELKPEHPGSYIATMQQIVHVAERAISYATGGAGACLLVVPVPRFALPAEDVAALTAIAEERVRQIRDEGYVPKEDDRYWRGELAAGAAAYVLAGCGATVAAGRTWPWANGFKPKGPDRDNPRAGALLVAEMGRRARNGAAGGEG